MSFPSCAAQLRRVREREMKKNVLVQNSFQIQSDGKTKTKKKKKKKKKWARRIECFRPLFTLGMKRKCHQIRFFDATSLTIPPSMNKQKNISTFAASDAQGQKCSSEGKWFDLSTFLTMFFSEKISSENEKQMSFRSFVRSFRSSIELNCSLSSFIRLLVHSRMSLIIICWKFSRPPRSKMSKKIFSFPREIFVEKTKFSPKIVARFSSERTFSAQVHWRFICIGCWTRRIARSFAYWKRTSIYYLFGCFFFSSFFAFRKFESKSKKIPAVLTFCRLTKFALRTRRCAIDSTRPTFLTSFDF